MAGDRAGRNCETCCPLAIFFHFEPSPAFRWRSPVKHSAAISLSAALLACVAACDSGSSVVSTCTTTCSTDELSGTHWRASDTSALSDGIHTGTQEYRTDMLFQTDGFVAETLSTIDHFKTPAVKDSLEGPATPILVYWHTSHDTLFTGAPGTYEPYVYAVHGDTLHTHGKDGTTLWLRLP